MTLPDVPLSKMQSRTYHVAPRFDMAAKTGPLQLGSIVNDLQTLAPINSSEIFSIPDKLVKPCMRERGFYAPALKLMLYNYPAWVLATAPSEIHCRPQHLDEDEFNVYCRDIITTCFDPDSDYDDKILASDMVKTDLTDPCSKNEVYLITGLTVARDLMFGYAKPSERPSLREKDMLYSFLPPVPVEAELEFTETDIIVGYQVRRYAYGSSSVNSHEKSNEEPETVVVEDYLVGAKF